MTRNDRSSRTETGSSGSDALITDEERAAIGTLVEGTPGSTQVTEEVTVDALFRILHDPGHRYVLTYLLQSEGFASISELVDFVVHRTDASMTDSKYRHRITEELTQKHLPELDRLGLVRYNMERQIISPTEMTPLAGPYLKVALLHQQRLNERGDG